MHKKFEVNQTKIKDGCQSERKAAETISFRKMPLASDFFFFVYPNIFDLPKSTQLKSVSEVQITKQLLRKTPT